MILVKRVLSMAARAARWIGHELAETIRFGAEPSAVGRSLNHDAGSEIPSSIGGAMAAGAGRRIGGDRSIGSHSNGPED
jgi:hypothetical protein